VEPRQLARGERSVRAAEWRAMRFGEPKLQSVKLLFYVVESQVGVGTEVGEFSIFDARIAARGEAGTLTHFYLYEPDSGGHQHHGCCGVAPLAPDFLYLMNCLLYQISYP